MPCIDKICQLYQISQDFAGIFVAFGVSIPEMTTNILSCFHNNQSMIGFGFGTILGSGVFDFTVCLGIASIYSALYHKNNLVFNIQTIKRDFIIYALTLFYLAIILWDYRVSQIESAILCLFYPLYVLICFKSTNIERIQSNSSYFYQNLNQQKKDLNKQEIFIYQWAYIYRNFKENPFIIDYNYISYTLNEEKGIELDEEQYFISKNEEKIEKTMSQKFQQYINKMFQKFEKPWIFIFRNLLPIQRFPLLSFILIMIICFFQTQIIVIKAENIIKYLQISSVFFGLTLNAWTNNIGGILDQNQINQYLDILNASISAQQQRVELATSSIIGSQIINLQLCLGIPWVLIFLYVQKINIQFITNFLQYPIKFQNNQKIFGTISMSFAIVILTFLIMHFGKYKLSVLVGILLLIIYFLYFIFQLFLNI